MRILLKGHGFRCDIQLALAIQRLLREEYALSAAALGRKLRRQNGVRDAVRWLTEGLG